MSARSIVSLVVLILFAAVASRAFLTPGRAQLATPFAVVKPPAQSVPDAPKLAQGWSWDFFSEEAEGPFSDEPERRRSWSDIPDPDRPSRSIERRQRSFQPRGTYSTLCVRLCDGYHWPVSFSTTQEHFSRDAKKCEQACPSKSRLFVRSVHGTDPDGELSDLQGRPYAGLQNAFRFRKEYVRDCTCAGNPWDEEAIARHRAYAEATDKEKIKASGSDARWSRVSRSERTLDR